MSFKQLLIFLFQYIAEKELKQEYWKGNQNKKSRFIDLIYRLFNIMLGSNLKSPKKQNRRAALRRPAIKLLGASTNLRFVRFAWKIPSA